MSDARKLSTLVTAIALIACTTASLHADPLPGRDVLKFSQQPMDGTTVVNPDGTVGLFYGHDELSTAWGADDGTGNQIVYRGRFMADDFADTFNTPVVHVKWWGSYLDNNIVQDVDKFLITFESDVPASNNPAGFSHPGTPLLNQTVFRDLDGALTPGEGTFTEKMISPGGPPLGETLYEYNAELYLDKPFPQDNDTVYWLKIVALVDIAPGIDPMSDPTAVTRWGWHNRDYTVPNPLASPAVLPGETLVGVLPGGEPVWHFQDNAVEGDVTVFPGPVPGPGIVMPIVEQFNFTPTHYLDGIDGPAGSAGIPGISQFSKDLAFELYTVPEPGTFVLMILGLAATVACRRQVSR